MQSLYLISLEQIIQPFENSFKYELKIIFLIWGEVMNIKSECERQWKMLNAYIAYKLEKKITPYISK